MKNKIDFLKFRKEILNVPIGDEVKDKDKASNVRDKIYNNSIFIIDIIIHAIKNNDINLIKYVAESTKIELTNIRDCDDEYDHNILHIAAIAGNVEMMEYILNNTNIDPTARDRCGRDILHLAAHTDNVEAIKYILKAGVIDNIPILIYGQLTWKSDSRFVNSIEAIEYLLEDQDPRYEYDFSKQVFDEELFLKMFKHYVCKPQLAQYTIPELKKIYIKKAESGQLPETLVDGIPGILNEWAQEILYQECNLMSVDYALDYEYGYLPSLIQYFNAKDDNNLVCLKKWFKNFPNFNKQLVDFIKSVKELQDYVESPDKKEETKAKLEQLVAKLKTNLIEQVYNDVAGAYLNKLSKLPDDEILIKCIVNEHFAAVLKSIKPLFLITNNTQQKFSDIIKEYEVEKDKLEINFQDLIIMEDLELDETLTKCKKNGHFAKDLKPIGQLILDAQTQDKFSHIIEKYEVEKDKLKINFHDLIFQDSIEGLVLNDDTTGTDEKTTMGEYKPGSCFLNNID